MILSVAPETDCCSPENDFCVSFKASTLDFVCFCVCCRKEAVVSRSCWAEEVIPEKDCRVLEAVVRSVLIFSRLVIRLPTISLESSRSVAFDKVCRAVNTVSEIVSIKTSFTCVWIAVAPLSVTFGAMAFSFALE